MRPTYDEVQRLVVKMREGSTEARRELIEAHVGLAFKASEKFEDDEALSDALCKLVEAVDEFRTSGRNSATLPAYLKVALARVLVDRYRDTSGMGTREGGGRIYHHCARTDAVRFLHSGRGIPEPKDLQMVDLLDQVLSVCEDDREREMVMLLSESRSYQEVALKLGMTKTGVAEAMARLRLRFQVQERHSA